MKEIPNDQDFSPLNSNEEFQGTNLSVVFSLWDKHVEAIMLEAEKKEALRLLQDLNDATTKVTNALAHMLGTS